MLALVLALTVLTGCGPYTYYGGTGLHDATPAEVAGVWENVEGTRLAFDEDGTAILENLDGQDFDFDDGWRLSGTGTWQLTDDDGGQKVRLALTARTQAGTRLSLSTGEEPPPEPPSTYTWYFYVDRAQQDELTLFFFFGDPDAGNTYVMTRGTAP
ncbi:hypothetical protein [Streptomyces sp. NPDC092295]|uniref:hypothetical protein n=1 Tax=Streptomyces sp. NPDC092295 TaxID=3366011 RepID=UPI0038241350